MSKVKKAVKVGGLFITDPSASVDEQLDSIRKVDVQLKKYKKLSKSEQRNRMSEALNSGADRLRTFVDELATEYGVPSSEFSFWLLQQEAYTSFDYAKITVKACD